MPSGHHHHQQQHLVTTHEYHHQYPSPFMDDSSAFSITNPQYSPHLNVPNISHHHQFSQHHNNQFHQHQLMYQTQLEESAHSFCSLNFKLGLNENSSSDVNGGGGGALNAPQCQGLANLLHHDVPESRPNSLIMPNSWQTQEDSSPIKEPFWKPLNKCNEVGDEDNTGGKRYRSCELEEEVRYNKIRLEEKYRLFGELEAIYSLSKIGAGADQSGSGSALTGEIGYNAAPPAAAAAPAAPAGVDHGSETSIGVEEAASSLKKILKRKRKRKMKEKLGFVVGFFESLVKQVMEHQEGLHRKFLEAIERMDRGRLEREEAWRFQEAEKRDREASDRARHQALASSREALVVSYIQKISGHQNKEIGKMVDINSRWPRAEVEALIRARSSLEPKFQGPGLKGPLWEEISSAMAAMGYQRSSKRCKEKWENINKYFRKKKDSASANAKPKKRSQQSNKACSYFDQLDQLYSRTDDEALINGDPTSFSGFDGAQQKGGYSELLAFIVAQNPSCSTSNLNPSEMESSKSDYEGALDEKLLEGSHENEEDENISEEEEADHCDNDHLGD